MLVVLFTLMFLYHLLYILKILQTKQCLIKIWHLVFQSTITYSDCKGPGGGGEEGTRMARGGIRLVHGLTKSTLIAYFSGMKIDPKYAFLHAFFLICLSCPFKKFALYDQKHTLFPNFARFCTPKRCMRVHCLVLKNNPNYVNFWMSLIPPLTFECPPGVKQRNP